MSDDDIKKDKRRMWNDLFTVILLTPTLVVSVFLANRFQQKLCWPFINCNDYIPYIIGFVYALIVGNSSIELIRRKSMGCLQETRKLYLKEKDKGDPPMYLLGNIIGIAERVAYISAFLSGQLGFIAVWLAVKVTMSFRRFETTFYGREMLNSFILNSLLSLTYAFVGWKLIIWFYLPFYKYAIWLSLILPLFCLVLWWLLEKNICRWKKNPEYLEKMGSKLEAKQKEQATGNSGDSNRF